MYNKNKRSILEKKDHSKKLNHERPMKKKSKNEEKIKDLVTESNSCGNTEDNLTYALNKLNNDASKLNLPKSVIELAAKICRCALEKKFFKNTETELIIAASIYDACSRTYVPITEMEIMEVCHVRYRDLYNTYIHLTRELKKHESPPSPVKYVSFFTSELNLSTAVQSKAIEIIKQAEENGLTHHRSPTSIAATALFIASNILGEQKSQREIGDIAGVNEVIIQNRYMEFTEQLDLKYDLNPY
ncbi:hypothetical protein [Methanosphaera sp. BMS]|uniref:hypothetical protein n=1 Tax=Methanosphaera sp. BMS TaxID=1789762 RepID=UPI000DC1E75B|nr:hypothetical protein [Methanosphaera sp. BMS]AWX31691.1 hypothetical protein AW729_00690 [Methanosphaera sp. BMS]